MKDEYYFLLLPVSVCTCTAVVLSGSEKVQWPLLLLLSIGYFLTSAEVRDSHAWYLILYPMAAVGAVWGAAILIDRTKEQKKNWLLLFVLSFFVSVCCAR